MMRRFSGAGPFRIAGFVGYLLTAVLLIYQDQNEQAHLSDVIMAEGLHALDGEEQILGTLEWLDASRKIHTPGPGLLERIWDLYYNFTPFYPSALQLLSRGHPDPLVFGNCGTMTRISILVLDQLGIPNRKLQVGSDQPQHTVLEVWLGERFVVVDPESNHVFRDKGGNPLTKEDLKAGAHANADTYLYEFTFQQHIRYEKLGWLGDALSWFIQLIGHDPNKVPLPHLYERVYLVWLITLTAFAGTVLAGWVLVHRVIRYRRRIHSRTYANQ